MKDDTVILPLLNGADIHQRILEHITKGIVLPGCIYISSSVTGPGSVHHMGGDGAVIAGYDQTRRDFSPDFLSFLFSESKIPFTWKDDALPAIWSKFLFIAPLSLVTAAARKSFGEVLNEPSLVSDLRSIMGEIISVASTRGVNLDMKQIDTTLQQASVCSPDTRTSFQRDIEAGKEKDERGILGGMIIRSGEAHGIDVPVTSEYYRRLPVYRR